MISPRGAPSMSMPPLARAAQIDLDQAQGNYVRNVLRLSEGARILVFNGRDGEWETRVAISNRKYVTLAVEKLTRPQEPRFDLHYLFAPLKQARQDYMVEKAVEMGAGLLRPVLTCRTQSSRINGERMHAHAVAKPPSNAEFCRFRKSLPRSGSTRFSALGKKIALLVFCDEDAPPGDPLAVLRPRADTKGPQALAVLIGPEGGSSTIANARRLPGLSCVVRSRQLGPRSRHLARRHGRSRGSSPWSRRPRRRLARIKFNVSLYRLHCRVRKIGSGRSMESFRLPMKSRDIFVSIGCCAAAVSLGFGKTRAGGRASIRQQDRFARGRAMRRKRRSGRGNRRLRAD